MTKKQRRQLGTGWAIALVLALTALVTGTGVTSALAADDPSTSPSPSSTPTDSASPSSAPNEPGSPSESPSETPSDPPTSTDTPSATATDTPSATGSASPLQSKVAPAAPKAAAQRSGCRYGPQDRYAPRDGTYFNHPFDPRTRSKIRTLVYRTVRSVPCGGAIRLAEFSLNDATLVSALITAYHRGVSVQVIANNHVLTNSLAPTLPKSPSFIHLRKVLGHTTHRPGRSDNTISFAKICSHSCRGTGGNVHYKLFLFSSAGPRSSNPHTGQALSTGRHWITMMGSPNLTTKAAYGQWNHLDVYSNKSAYNGYINWFRQMKADRPQRHPYQRMTTGYVTSWTFPKPAANAATDPLMQGLNGIRCKGATHGTGIHGRTKIRIGAYTFFDTRGRWIAKKVRSLWNAGCDVAIEYSIMGDTVKHILYNPSGRGRIPMRQVVTFFRNGKINAYDHSKYITMSGHYGSKTAAWMTWTGTTNISNLGFRSDDTQQVWHSSTRYRAYARDFYRNWRQKHAHVPSPTSRIGVRIGTKNATLGKGKYARLDPS